MTRQMTQDMTQAGTVYWITGLSGAGKSTVCRALVDRLRSQGRNVLMLDGDELRALFKATGAHRREERLALALRYAGLCNMLASQGADVAIATISLFHEVHAWNRANLPGYLEIYLDVPLAELARRDSKGLYGRAARGEVRDVAGLDCPVDAPLAPHVPIHWSPGLTVDDCVRRILAAPGLDFLSEKTT